MAKNHKPVLNYKIGNWEIVMGRTYLGIAFAHLCRGSEVVKTSFGLTHRGAARRVQKGRCLLCACGKDS